ncbi:ATPase, T2SS/T4P/T4SS family [Proteus myxofaciens]|uniref:Putative ATP-binding translocase/pilus biosynthesis protein n=1 Tax=Proteus myxofaciens ATCC 19692 TaxID=1354337 RepID=A0A198FPU5_9GAMM|nr:ATPase, T2SS/T4P/T4SS family [Proteus myxofaciens]OAT26474.1 putative ATP-binding translocase/pilus biosynthesis protein [Proteus myxofaciens ATCC 19692]
MLSHLDEVDFFKLTINRASLNNLPYEFTLLEKNLVIAEKDGENYLLSFDISTNNFSLIRERLIYINKKYKLYVNNILLVEEVCYFEILEQYSQQVKAKTSVKASDVQIELEQLLTLATESGASDLHITRGDILSKIEFRINGELRLHSQMYSARCDELVFVLYNVEATTKETTWNRQIPQSANILYTLNDKKFRFRYAHFPIFGESPDCYHCVLRIISADIDKVVNPSLEKTGFSPEEIADVKKILSNPYGVYFIAGTTGSGKSTTLKTVMEWLQINRYDDKGCFITVEDPVEYYIYGTKQSSVLDVSGGGFHAAIKSALRRDPDVLMIGEIRDTVSSNALAGAVESGHYCFTTVHAGSIVTLLQRLSALGITGDKLSTPGFIAGLQCQKLMPVVCPNCCNEKTVTLCHRTISVKVKNNDGCKHCKFTGIKGRKLIAEYMLPKQDELVAISRSNWLDAYIHWRKKRFTYPGISEGFSIKEKTMAFVIKGMICYDWFTHEFGNIEDEDMEIIFEKIH